MEINKVNLQDKLDTFTEYWNPKIVGELNNQQVKLAKFKGNFINHKHDLEDELFLVLSGILYIKLEHKTLELNAGEFVIIPKGVLHQPYAPEEVSVMLFEPMTTVNTGDNTNDLTVNVLDRI